MSKFKITGLVILGCAALAIMYGIGKYNSLVGSDQAVQASYAQVQNVMDRQVQLIPNLVEVVKNFANHETQVFTQVAEARSQVAAISKIDPSKIANDPELQKQLIQAQSAMNNSLLKLTSVAEAYPQLQSSPLYTNLMTELTGSQNRISVERRRSQQLVQEFNTSVSKFPTNLLSGWFPKKPYFEAPPEAQNGVKVNFN